jgi:hypothetical protein
MYSGAFITSVAMFRATLPSIANSSETATTNEVYRRWTAVSVKFVSERYRVAMETKKFVALNSSAAKTTVTVRCVKEGSKCSSEGRGERNVVEQCAVGEECVDGGSDVDGEEVADRRIHFEYSI